MEGDDGVDGDEEGETASSQESDIFFVDLVGLEEEIVRFLNDESSPLLDF